MPRATILVVFGVLLGCAATAVVTKPAGQIARAAAVSIEQSCTSTGDFNNVEKLDQMVRAAGRDGWALIGVYRATNLGATHEDYICFRRER